MKKLLFFASDFTIGLSALLCDQLVSIDRAGIDYVAVAGEKEQENGLGEMLKQKGIMPIRIDGFDEHKNFSQLVNRIKEIVLKENIDIIHVQNNWQLAIAGYVKMSLRMKRKVGIVYTLHGFRHNSPVKSRIAQVVIGSALLSLADHVICMTQYLKKKFSLLSYKIDIIPLGVKDDFFIPEFVAPPSDALHIIFPAQFREGKNQDLIIRAFAGYIKKTSDKGSTLTLPGNGPMLDTMKQLAKSLDIERQVIFPGLLTKDEIKKCYLNSNLAVVASNSETFGQSIVEPFVLGRCIISTPVGIAPEIIENGENGFFFQTEGQLTDILVQLSRDRYLITKIGQRNFQSRNIFSWESITKQYISKILLKP